MDHYQTLGIQKNATTEEIKKAYRRLASKYHPDREGGDTARFQQIEHAYRILSDQDSRHQYDNPAPQFQGFPGGFRFDGANPFEDILNQFTRQAQAPRQNIYTITVFVTLTQVANGSTEAIQVQTDDGVKTFQIRIPPFVEDGQRIRYDGLMPSGPLMITFRIHRHPVFERRGIDLFMTRDISIFDLVLGTTIFVPTIREQTLEITIPPGTKPGSTFRIPNHGLETPNQKGCQFVLINAVIPDTISQEIILALEKDRASKQN